APDDEVDARQCSFREGRIIGRYASVESGLEISPDALAHFRIVPITRDEDDHRDKTVELVDAHEGAHTWPLSKRKDRLSVLAQDRYADLEKLVARIGFQHVDERLAGMIVGIKTG